MTINWAGRVAAIVLSSVAATAAAQAADNGALSAAPAPAPSPICCTVPADAIQIEADVMNWTRLDAAGAQIDTILYTNSTLKHGLGAATDIEVDLAPYETVRTLQVGVGGNVGLNRVTPDVQSYLGIAARF